MKVGIYFVCSLQSPHRGGSNEFTQYTIFNIKIHPKLSQICIYGIISKVNKDEFETAVVNEASLFELLKVYCICRNSSDNYF